MTVCFSVSRIEFVSRHPQPIVALGSISVNDPAGQNGKTFFNIRNRDLVKIKPLTAGVSARKLFGEQITGTRKGFPGDVPR